MIDNPLEQQTLETYDSLYKNEKFEELCKDHAQKLAEDNYVFKELVEDFQDWFYMYCIDHPEDMYASSLPDDSTLIDDWWDWVEDHYDNYSNPYDIEPSDDQMMSMFGTKWHDGL